MRNVDNLTSSSSTWTLATQWLKMCRDQHVSCSERIENGDCWHPSRLLDIGHQSSGEVTIKLIQTAEVKPDGDYVTLSHCWGKGVLVTTLQKNLEDFLVKVPSLPKTFEDTIFATQMLGVRYLWIDSLCIIQDDGDDWMKESSLMDKVYKNALCNLSASASMSSSDGLFRPRASHLLSELKIKLQLSQNQKK